MKHYFQAEQLKYRHTSVAAITLGMPMFTALLAFWLTSSYFSVDVYNWWYIGLYPGFLGILCSIIGKKDKQKKNYTIWSLPCGMEQIWDAKILVGIKMSAVAVAGLTLFSMMGQMLLESVGNLKMRQAIPIQAQILAGIVLWLTTLWEIPFCLPARIPETTEVRQEFQSTDHSLCRVPENRSPAPAQTAVRLASL